VRDAYARRAAASPGRMVRVDGSRPLDEVRAEVLRVLAERLPSAIAG
jgi:thymidylate kinase